MLLNFDLLFDRPPQPAPTAQLRQRLACRLLGLAENSQELQLQPLTGGYRNWNEALSWQGKCRVLRLTPDIVSLQRELALLRRLKALLAVPEVCAELPEAEAHAAGYGAALLEFCPGTLVSRLPRDSRNLDRLGRAIGSSLARLHSAGPARVAREILPGSSPTYAAAWLAYVRQALTSDTLRARAGAELCRRLLRLIESRVDWLEEAATERLVHSDFNLKNLLAESVLQGAYTEWHISAVLDWEFAHLGAPLADLGNFLRFEESLPFELTAGFIRGYRTQADTLPSNWRQRALFLDLAALIGFLDSPEARPLSWNTARQRLAHSLARLVSS